MMIINIVDISLTDYLQLKQSGGELYGYRKKFLLNDVTIPPNNAYNEPWA